MADRELSSPPTGRDRLFEIVVVVLVLGGVLGALVVLVDRDSTDSGAAPVTSEQVESTLGATSQPFAPDRACDVYVVPVDSSSDALAVRLARELPDRVPVKACATSSFRLDLAAFDRRREQLDAVIVSDQLARAFQDARGITPATILGVTAFDIYSSTFAQDEFDFGVAKQFPQKQGFAVVSTARMESGDARSRRLDTMAMRYLGFLHFGLPESPSSSSALGPAPRSLEELDRLEPQLADPPPTTAELEALRKAFLARK